MRVVGINWGGEYDIFFQMGVGSKGDGFRN